MATAKKTITQIIPDEKLIDDNHIITLYMEHVLMGEEGPKTIYAFCKKNGFDESDFYTFFGSFDNLKQEIWNKFLENAITTLHNDDSFATYSPKNKLLTLYFTLFEILTLNRSYVLFVLKDNKQGMSNLMQLKQFRMTFKEFVKNNIATEELKSSKLSKITKPVYSEGSWIQFLLILKFWMGDNSKSFEKTDIIIEKSVNTVVDLLDSQPLENIIDLGKFLWSERKM
ncbi:TetR family transcriptional regulator C-terminal domain-containing protein [Flavobacterium antarcticum]|uniref:TetR family transcriptional regulator C-terminal domain-containing protein n=1 Tax=Flavobacterium antarcticum TaxID=271155 RepID=UPI0003B4190F|nr:TetR family transcriptional regulator C-terminal domain-containing protein [Flavobacterium antarcticum]